ncbi:MAG: DUF3419 family protein, partial [Alphaproteobacteria bacterium]|nr:DUF3419 family protein [Alphaproteobacteria bacterium]
MFTYFFQGFVYNQIWEDPDVDVKAMRIGPDTRILTIASGGCNILNYLAAGPRSVTAVDLNPNHLALTRLKIAAVKHAPDYESFFRMFGEGKDARNAELFDKHLADKVDAETRAYWNGRMGGIGRRINMFTTDFYRYSLLGRFIGMMRRLARLYGLNPAEIL